MATAAKGLNDNAHGIDRFGYRVCVSPLPLLPHRLPLLLLDNVACGLNPNPSRAFGALGSRPTNEFAALLPTYHLTHAPTPTQPLAQALAAMLKRAEPPICVGLYARWGAGKTFMISLLKKEFDPSVYEHPDTHQLLQFFEEGYPEPEQAETEKVCSRICSLLLNIMRALVPTMPYGVATFFSVVCDAFRSKPFAKTTPAGGGRSYEKLPHQSGKEYIFVDFNAWECAACAHLCI